MFHLLDRTLKDLLEDAQVIPSLPTLANVDVTFVTPDKNLVPKGPTVNLFLYETRENRELRDPVPINERNGPLNSRRWPPLRVDCAYMVTTWMKDEVGGDRIGTEHALLAETFNWLSRFPFVPERNLQAGGLTGQVFAPPTLVAQMDAAKNVGEFWSALGIAPRPFFNLVVTISMDLEQALTEFPVTTVMTSYQQGSNAASAEQRIAIGGIVRDRADRAVRDAWVRLEPGGLTTVSDADGRFIFDNVAGGAGMTLRARAPGKGEATLAGLQIPSPTGNYNLQFPN